MERLAWIRYWISFDIQLPGYNRLGDPPQQDEEEKVEFQEEFQSHAVSNPHFRYDIIEVHPSFGRRTKNQSFSFSHSSTRVLAATLTGA